MPSQQVDGIGIANLPNQRHKIVSRKGTTFTILVVGESGTGKTTFINTLFTTTLREYKDPAKRHKFQTKKSVDIEVVRVEFEEKGFSVQLNVVDTPGFGDYVNNKESWTPIIDFIDGQHENYLRQELQPMRSDILDGRVHVCLYFIAPSGHNLRPLDVEVMKRIGTRAPLIPVIAKADTLSPAELKSFKEKIREAIDCHQINVYASPIVSEDESTTERNRSIMAAMPFAIIGSEEDVMTPDGRRVKGRQYPWGVSEVENDDHCDFKKLRSLLIRTHMLDLITTTEEVHYESYRSAHVDANGKIIKSSIKKDSKFKEEEDALRKRFTEQVKQEETRFRTWEQRLIAERDRLNKDLEQEHGHIQALTMEIKALEERVPRK